MTTGPAPCTVFFTGHMFDRPGRLLPRFPESMAPLIAERIAADLAACGATDGFASATCGADLLFHEALVARGARAHIVLPCNVESFVRDCVDIVPGSDWVPRFRRLLEKACRVHILADEYASDNAMASELCNRIMIGMARDLTRRQGGALVALALWDGRPGDAYGGTHSAVSYCQQQGLDVRLMQDLAATRTSATVPMSAGSATSTSAIRRASAEHEAPQHICALMFSDAVGYSALTERQIPAFVRRFLGCATEAMQTQGVVPLVKNTWGDAFYFVFEDVRQAGIYALDLRDRILRTDWSALGLPPVSIRIALHVGALYRVYDPVIAQWTYVGAQVTRAARMEPIAEPGRVFASASFAALASADGVDTFRCVPAGRRALHKDAGEAEAYEVIAAEAKPG